MKTRFNLSKIMSNAWYMKKTFMKTKSFGECLRKAWRNEKIAVRTAQLEGRTLAEPKVTVQESVSPSFIAGCLAYYQSAPVGTYFGD